MASTSSLERELKLAAPAGFRLPEFSGLGAGLCAREIQPLRHEAEYWDTGDLRLMRWGCGLRYRDSDGWTAKLPAEAEGAELARRELRFEGPRHRPPAAAVDLLLGITRRRKLAPLVRLQTLRDRVTVSDGAGRLLAEVTNDYVSALRGGRVARRFREVEVEFTADCPRDLVLRIAARLREAGTGPAHQTAKHVRALGLHNSLRPEVELPVLGGSPSAAEVVQLSLARAVRALVRHDAGVRLDEDVEDLHQMRVAARRLRSQLRTFGELLDGAWADSLGAELHWLRAELGPIRDADVLGARLVEDLRLLGPLDGGPAKDLLDHLHDQRRGHMARLSQVLRSGRYLDLVERLVEAGRGAPWTPAAARRAEEVLPAFVRRRWRRFRRSARKLERDADAALLHGLRIRGKHLRYAAEVAQPVFGRRAGQLARGVRAVQQVLGEHQDAVTAVRWLRRVAPEVPREAAFSAGLLAAREEERARRQVAEWPEAWKRLRQAGGRRWLRGGAKVGPS